MIWNIAWKFEIWALIFQNYIDNDFWPGTITYRHNYTSQSYLIILSFKECVYKCYRWVSSLDKSLCVRVCVCVYVCVHVHECMCVCLWAHTSVCVCGVYACVTFVLFTHDHVIPDCACYSAPRHKLPKHLLLKLFVLLFMNNWMKFKIKYLHILN